MGSELNLTDDPTLLGVLDALDFIQFKLSTVICSVGIIGNVLAVLVCVYNQRLRRSTCGTYLSALALYDSIYLACLIVHNLGVNGTISITSPALCAILVFLGHSSSCLSPLCVCAFTVERFVVVRYPLKRASICTLSKVRKILLFMLPYPLVVFGVLASRERVLDGSCALADDEASLVINVAVQVVDILVSCVIPLLLIFSLNIMIARDLLRARKQHRAMVGSVTSNTSRDRSAREEELARKKETSITSMLFIVSMAFAVLNLPSYMIRIKAQYVLAIARDQSIWTVWDEIAEKVATVLYIINFAIDFLLYNASSANFRTATGDALRSTVCWKKIQRPRSVIWRSTGSGRTTQTELVNDNGSMGKNSIRNRVTGVQEARV